MEETKTYSVFGCLDRHARLVIAGVLVGALTLGALGSAFADTADSDFDPDGEIFGIADRADSTLRSESSIGRAAFLVESLDGGDVLTAAALAEWSAASGRVRAEDAGRHLATRYDAELEVEVTGVTSIADAVDSELAMGFAAATDADVKAALARILDPAAGTAGLRFSLSEHAMFEAGVWSAPAFIADITYDEGTFASYLDVELWLRDVQATVRDGATTTDPIGIAIDGDLSFEEAAQAAAPFIFLAVALIVLLIAIVHRSYWSSVVVAIGLGATMLTYYGVAALIGLKMGSLLLAFIVPIAMASFGVDFYIHGAGRVRESEIEQRPGGHAPYPAGMKAVFGAMLLAALSSVAAFLSNAVSGTEAIVEFGIGSAVALAAAYVVLGQVAPRALLAAEVLVGAGPRLRWSRPAYWIGQVVVAVIGGLAVALAAVMPSIGTVAVASLALIAGVISAIAARRRNRRAMARGAALRDEALGSGHGIRSVGSFVAALAARRIVTVPVIVVVAILSLTSALKVKSGFEVNDFLASDTDFAQSIERTAKHFPSSGEGSSFILVEGNLTDPAALASLEDAVAGLDSSDARFGRRSSGEFIVGWHAADLVRMTTSSPRARHDLAASGVTIVDENGDGIPDTADQVRAVYDYIALEGVLALDGSPAVIPADMGAILYDDGSRSQATAIVIQVGSFTDGAIIEPVRGALEDAAAAIETDVAGLSAGVSGDVLTQFVSLESFTRSMLVALPLAILLTLLVAGAVLRSLR